MNTEKILQEKEIQFLSCARWKVTFNLAFLGKAKELLGKWKLSGMTRWSSTNAIMWGMTKSCRILQPFLHTVGKLQIFGKFEFFVNLDFYALNLSILFTEIDLFSIYLCFVNKPHAKIDHVLKLIIGVFFRK